MSAPRIAVDGLWRFLCPAFDSIVLSRARLPVSRASYRPCVPRRTLRPSSLKLPVAASRRQNSTLAKSVNVSNDGDFASEVLDVSESISETPLPDKWGALSIVELHDILRTVRDESGSYQKTIHLVQYLIKNRGERPNVRHFDVLIRANADAERGSAEEVEGLLKEMDKQGIIGDSGLYHSVLMTLAVHPNHLLRAEILTEMKARWISLTPLGYHHLIISHLRDREYELALSVFYSLHHRHISVEPWLYDILIYVFSEAGELSTALSILQSRAEDPDRNPLYPDPQDVSPGVWPYFLDTCAAAYDYAGVLYMWRKRVEIDYLRPSDGTLANVLNTAALAGDPALATSALKMLADRKGELPTSSYEAMLEAYATAKDVTNAFRVLCIMGKAGGESTSKTPSSATTRPLFKLLREEGPEVIQDAWKALTLLQEEGKEIPIAAVNVILEAAASSGELGLAMRLYKELVSSQSAPASKTLQPDSPSTEVTARPNIRYKTARKTLRVHPDTTTINVLLQGCTKIRSSLSPKRMAMYLASEMARQGIRPDELTYDRLILVCLHEGQQDYEDAFRYLEEMAAMGWQGRVRNGTWHALARRFATERDGRVDTVLEMMDVLGLETGKLRGVVGELWEAGPGERRRAARDGVSGGEDDGMAVDVGVGDGVEGGTGEAPQDEQPVWGNLRRKHGSS
ncbi:hypothetical protein VC83_02255 [Pseudogymnoascus destructans]|uniref:Pentatricopeptide repeat-containing protein-mitochondrial domain-containing protein n=2 Tax=Pseudogymnoascus destructans TaxID=655981 RepID=L8G9D6_PSED2|nr:uncharacterized protein VC83_02255 [Pseudogymnoascus destructans]ELR08626.1 hypothetical protein GMDG_03317 [Pseudogymnoascus destructans 20631-21]OAF61587.1 hypothetical protein VC83_02255 [Pseudogymnoascus destructans]